ncbi:hypothetical protein ABW21_db0207594 [Orbilia brochopaga]|nr:hypothetical protein ABW21_db0207594 [Drechslerella brochopaga]
MTPIDPITRKWWDDTWTLGIQVGPGVLMTFVVEDLSRDNKLVAFIRWHVPQLDGKQDIPLPDFPSEWDAELTEAFWGGMVKNRAAVMGRKPHWMGEFIGVDPAYQHKGLAVMLMDWACRQADAADLEIYGDATDMARPLWKKYFGFQDRLPLHLPSRPDTFGDYFLTAIVRPPNSGRMTGQRKHKTLNPGKLNEFTL